MDCRGRRPRRPGTSQIFQNIFYMVLLTGLRVAVDSDPYTFAMHFFQTFKQIPILSKFMFTLCNFCVIMFSRQTFCLMTLLRKVSTKMELRDLIERCCGKNNIKCPEVLSRLYVKNVDEFCLYPVRDFLYSDFFQWDLHSCLVDYYETDYPGLYRYLILKRSTKGNFSIRLKSIEIPLYLFKVKD